MEASASSYANNVNLKKMTNIVDYKNATNNGGIIFL